MVYINDHILCVIVYRLKEAEDKCVALETDKAAILATNATVVIRYSLYHY